MTAVDAWQIKFYIHYCINILPSDANEKLKGFLLDEILDALTDPSNWDGSLLPLGAKKVVKVLKVLSAHYIKQKKTVMPYQDFIKTIDEI